MANKYVIISNSYTTNGNGADYQPFTWSQFLADISGGGAEGLGNNINYYLSGTRSLTSDTTITISALGTINLYSWSANNSISIIQNLNNDIYFEQYCPNFGLYDLMVQAKMSGTSNNLFDDGYRSPAQDYGNLIVDNCYFKFETNTRLSNLSSVIIKNSVIISTNFDGSCSTTNGMTVELYNNIFDISNFSIRPSNNIESLTVDNCAFTSALTAFTGQDTSDWTNIHESWTRPSLFSSAVSAINISTDLKYINSPFSLISATGDTDYTRTWLNGRRDGIGALYFPEMSGFAVSASSASAPLDYSLNFVISGNNPFTVFSASSATYDWDDNTSNSAVNNNNVISHSFSANGSYQVESVIKSFNEWYSVTATSWIVLVGDFNVTIVIYDRYGNDITGLSAKPLSPLTFSASVNGLAAGSYLWDLGDSYSANTQTYTQSYLSEGLKNIRLSAYALDDETVSAIDTNTITISAISAEYFVNIMSAYDVCTNNAGTSADPFNWSEFKGRVETSGEYLDTYRLSGSRVLSGTTTNRNLLNIDRTKNFTIRDWSVSSYGPWVIQAKDFSTSNSNSIISAAGCTLKNGIIYNKKFSSPGYGGQITIGTTYDMFIVYQGTYSHIIVDPFRNILSGGIVSGTSSTTIWSLSSFVSGISSNYCAAPDWVYMDTFIEEDFTNSAYDTWWDSDYTDNNYISAYPPPDGKYVSLDSGNGTYDALLTPTGVYISGDFDLRMKVIWRSTCADDDNTSIHFRLYPIDTTATFPYGNFCEVRSDVPDYPDTYEIGWFGPDGYLEKAADVPKISAYSYYWLGIERKDGSVSGKYDIGNGWEYFANSITCASDIFIGLNDATNPGIASMWFQADGGFPYTSAISSGIVTIPTWVSAWADSRDLSSCYWIDDDFETSSFNCWWSSQFRSSYNLSSVSGSMVAIANFEKDSNTPFTLLSYSGTSLSGDFVIETSIFRRETANHIQGISIFATSANVNNFGGYSATSGCIVRIGTRANSNSISGSINDSSLSSVYSPLSASIIGLKIQRNNDIISAFCKDGELDWTPTSYTNISNSANVYVVVEGNGYEGFDYLKIAAPSGLPNTYNFITSSVSSTSSFTVTSGGPGNIVASATANIIGSTIYLSAINVSAWQEVFLSADFSAIGQSAYNFNITDSVITNFRKENSNYFCNGITNVIINNSTFNLSSVDISADFGNNFSINSQFNWTTPSDYPFTSNNALYDKDIDYIRANKKKLRPFSGITAPPNPGYNFSAYPGYETGLFGFSRKDYKVSGSGA